jgi:hypothetical protein
MAANPNFDRLERRVMFAMDFRDPVTRLPVAEELKVAAEGLGPPVRAPSGLFVWFDLDPPAQRQVKVTAISTRKRYADFEEVITAPEHVPDIPASSLVMPRALRPTGLYEPPEGMTGVAGWLVEDEHKVPVPGAEISLAFRHAGNQDFVSAYRAVTDSDGRFVAVANDLGDVVPDPAPAGSEARILGWLEIGREGETRYSAFQPLRTARLARVAAPFLWASLDSAPPQ